MTNNPLHLRRVILYYKGLEIIAIQAHRRYVMYRDNAVLDRTVSKWQVRFRDGNYNPEDKDCWGNPVPDCWGNPVPLMRTSSVHICRLTPNTQHGDQQQYTTYQNPPSITSSGNLVTLVVMMYMSHTICQRKFG